jgi:hypothetical protein
MPRIVKPRAQWNKRATLPQLEDVFRIISPAAFCLFASAPPAMVAPG